MYKQEVNLRGICIHGGKWKCDLKTLRLMKLRGSGVRLTSVTVWDTVPQTTRLGNYLHRGPIRRAAPEQDGRNQSPRLVMRNIFLSAAERLISGWTDGSTGPVVLRWQNNGNSIGLRGWTVEQGYLHLCRPLTTPGLQHRSPALRLQLFCCLIRTRWSEHLRSLHPFSAGTPSGPLLLLNAARAH